MSDKNNKLRELRRKRAALRCENEYCSCSKCENKELCDRLYNEIKKLEEE